MAAVGTGNTDQHQKTMVDTQDPNKLSPNTPTATDVLSGTPEYHSKTKRPMKETLVLASAFLCVFTSFEALQNLQSSLHQLQGLGVASLACIYGISFAVSFITPAIIYHVGVRGTILVAWLGHFVYVGCNFYPHWVTMIPGSLLLGALSCPLWTSVNTYLFSLARMVVEQDLQRSPKVVTTVHAAFSRLSGVFSAVFFMSQLTGNLLSSIILFQSSYNHSGAVSSSSSSAVSSSSSAVSSSSSSAVSSSSSTCGVEYCLQAGEGKHLAPPEAYIVNIMLGMFMTLDAAGIVITWCFVPSLEQPRYTGCEVCRKLHSYWQAFAQPKLWLLVPIFAGRGMVFSLHIGLFTEAYIGCALGTRMVGYVMAVWGCSMMLSAALLGYAARYTGRRFLFGFAFVLDAAIFIVFLFWRPHAGSLPVFFSLSAVMGLVDGIWNVQCNALIVVLFPAIFDSVFSVSGTWNSLSISSSFILAKFLCPAPRIHIALGILGAALLGYVAVEVAHWHSLRSFHRAEQHYMLVNTDVVDRGERLVEGEWGTDGAGECVEETELLENEVEEVNGE